MPRAEKPGDEQPASVPKEVRELMARFGQQLDAYKSGQYNEAQLRQEFLNPLFKVLGWDMDNEQGYAEAYKDVIHEDAIRIGGAVKAPDYCFRIGGTRKFFLEAKKPSVCIKDEPSAAYQLRRYAYTAKLPLSILSDFEEFAVYDCRAKPHKDDSAAKARVFYCAFHDFAGKWDWIASIFSREAVLKGSFDRYAESTKGKKGTSEFDQDFLATIEGWRLELARNLPLRNPKLTQRELNFAVQRIIDRIIFLRICEDRGIEDYGRLRALTNGDRIYPRLCQLFEAADTRYNSGLFHFQKEKARHEAPDELTLGLELDDRLLREILHGLYYPDSPYEFSVLSADILGQVYEQFLGKVIRLTEGHRAVVDDKPEVKKAGGVYYTPTYIVDYIVRQTVGRLLEDCLGKSRGNETPTGAEKHETPHVVSCDARAATTILKRVSKLRMLDPACGSGSFLIGAYQCLLDWHLQFYIQLLGNSGPGRSRGDETQTEKSGKEARLLTSSPTIGLRGHWLLRGRNPPIVQTTKGWKLTIAERKRILLNNIFGVDIDPQAVEVTKLSLLLKALEGETGQSLQTVFRLFQERALPDLGDNIKCGNSLIGPDFYQQSELPRLTDEERYRINVFDWHAEFPQVFRRRRGDESQISSEEENGDFSRRLLPGEGGASGELRETAAASPLDYTMPGVPLHGSYSEKRKKGEKAAPPPPREPEWEGGFDAVIGNPPYVLLQDAFRDDRQLHYFRSKFASASYKIDTYHLFMEQGINLARAGGRCSMITPANFLTNNHLDKLRRLVLERTTIHQIVVIDGGVFPGISVDNAVFVISPGQSAGKDFAITHARIDAGKLSQTNQITVSPACALADAHVLFTGTSEGTSARLWQKITAESWTLGEIADVNFGKQLRDRKKFTTDVIPVASLRGIPGSHRPCYTGRDVNRYSLGWSRLACLNDEAARSGGCWDTTKHDATNKLVTRQIGRYPDFALDAAGWHCLNTMFMVNLRVPKPDPRYVLGILNSKLTRALWLDRFYDQRRTFPKIKGTYLRQLPIRRIDFSAAADKAHHDRLVALVEQMLALHRQLAAARTPQEQTALERQSTATDAQIDRLVYDLYGLTEEEIRIVEGGAVETAASQGKE